MLKIDKTLRLTSDQYYPEITKKTQIFLHHTVGGSAQSTFNYWQGESQHIATAFLIERDGTIYEVFDPKYWAHHLGKGTTEQMNRQSIGIELCSEGALRSGLELNAISFKNSLGLNFDENYLFAFDIDPTNKPKTDWLKKAKKLYNIDTDTTLLYDTMPAEWRGYTYFDGYDEAQIQATCELVKYLCELFSIPKQLLEGNKNRMLETNNFNWSGVLAHCNVRSDKTDVHLKFPWKRLEYVLQN